MNGYEHYQRAEELATSAHAPDVIHSTSGQTLTYKHSEPERVHMIASAHVHALLALAAATADASRFRDDLYAGNGEPVPGTVARKRRAADKSASVAADFLPDGV